MKSRSILLLVAGMLASCCVWAAALVQSASGDVRLESGGASRKLAVSERVEGGATVHTGADGEVMLRFDDGQVTALSANSSFRIDEFRFDAAKPEQGNVVMSILKGALRTVTGLIGRRDRSKFALRTPNATLGIRGTDFMVALVNPVYLSVVQGAITATNVAGTVSFAAGTTGMVASSAVLGTSIAASALPAAVSASFAQLGALPMASAAGASSAAGSQGATGASGASSASGASGAAGASSASGAASAAGASGVAGASGAAGAVGATSAAVGGLTAGAVAAGALAVGVVVGATSNPSGATTGTTGTTGTR